MSLFSYESLKAVISEPEKNRSDNFVNSPLYYLLTGRKGARLFSGLHSKLIVCAHPHIEECLMVFPEIGKADYELTASVLNGLEPLKNGVQLVRYTEDDIKQLKKQIAQLNYTPISGVNTIDESILDWRYPLHVLDTKKVAEHKGKDFKKVRSKFNQAAKHISYAPLNSDNALRMMQSVLKFWEGNMIYNEKDTDDMADFYHAFFDAIKNDVIPVNGLIFMDGKRPAGFTVWDQTSLDSAVSLVNLSDTTVTGLSEFQRVSTCKVLHDNGVQYFNMGGSETAGLDEFKRKFNPVKSLKIHSATVTYQHHANDSIETQELVVGL